MFVEYNGPYVFQLLKYITGDMIVRRPYYPKTLYNTGVFAGKIHKALKVLKINMCRYYRSLLLFKGFIYANSFNRNVTFCKRSSLIWFMVFNATFKNTFVISWLSVSFVEETGVPGEIHRPVASHRQTLSHNIVSTTLVMNEIPTRNFSDDRH